MTRIEISYLYDRCCIDGCDKPMKPGYIACRKHVRERKKAIRRLGVEGVALRDTRTVA